MAALLPILEHDIYNRWTVLIFRVDRSMNICLRNGYPCEKYHEMPVKKTVSRHVTDRKMYYGSVD